MKKKILYIQYTNPAAYPPLEHSSRILADKNWEILFLGIDISGIESLEFPKHNNINVIKYPKCDPGLYQKFHFFLYILFCIYWCFKWRPEWIYGSNHNMCIIIYLLTKIFSSKVIYHEHDSPNMTNDTFFEKIFVYFRKLIADKIDIVVLPNKKRIYQYRIETKREKDVYCVWNCPSLHEIPEVSTNKNKDLNIIYGRFYFCR